MSSKPLVDSVVPIPGSVYPASECQYEEGAPNCVVAGIPVEIVPVSLLGLIAPVALVGALV